MTSDRRRFLGAAAGAIATTGVTLRQLWPKHSVDYRRARSRVAVLTCETYSEKLEELLLDGLKIVPDRRSDARSIEMVGDRTVPLSRHFEVLPAFSYLIS